MTDTNDVVKKMAHTVQAKCAERVELSKKYTHKPHIAIEEYGVTNIMKKRYNL